MTDETNLFNAPEGVKIIPGIIVQVNHYWGRGLTIGAAWKNVVKEAGRTVAYHKKNGYLIYSVMHYVIEGNEEMTVRNYINDMGQICYHKDYPPHLIDQKK